MEDEHSPSAPAYVEPRSGRTYPLSEPRWRSDEGLPLMISPLPGIGRGDIRSGARSLWRYAASFPIPVADPVSIDEAVRLLVERRWGGAPGRLLKLEWFAPTGSFKDRGASVMISIFSQQGVTELIEDSSGNGGAAIAAYAAAAGIKAKILVPATTQPGKTVQMRASRSGGPTDPGQPPGHGRRGRASGRADFLRQPQLASLFSPGDEDAGLRALGGPADLAPPTTSSSPPAPAATSSAATSASANSCGVGRSSGFPGSSPSSPQTARPSARASPRALKTPCP